MSTGLKKLSWTVIVIGLFSSYLANFNKKDELFRDWNNKYLADTVRLRAVYDLIWLEYLNKENDTALLLTNDMIHYAKEQSNLDYLEKAYISRGEVYFYISNIDSASYYYNLVLSNSKGSENKKNRAVALHRLAYLQYLKRDYQKSIKTNLEALEIKKAINDEVGVSATYVSLAQIYNRLGDFEKALKYSFKSKYIAQKEKDDSQLMNTSFFIGNLYYNQGKHKEALRYYFECLKSGEKSNDLYMVSSTYHNISNVYYSIAKLDSAVFYVKKSIDLSLNNKNYYDVASSLLSIGSIYHRMLKHDSAHYYYLRAVDMSQEYQNPEVEIIALNNIGMLFKEKGEFNKADNYIKEALSKAEKSNDLNNVKESFYALFELNEEINKSDEALKFYKRYVEIKDSIENNEIKNELIKREEEYKYKVKAYEDSSNFQHKLSIQNLKFENEKNINQWRLIGVGFIFLISLLSAGVWYFYQKNRTKNQISKLKNQALRLQINPHFFFNAMNSINRYIGNNEPIMAKSYLTKFSKVMRLSLDSVQEDVVPLSQEIEFLTSYIEIEKLQHKNFEYEIVVEESLDIDEIVVPPILIQPYIENAILHGFINKTAEEKGYIKITFSKKEAFLSIVISDNGVGLDSSQVIKTGDVNHKSLAMKITQKRINAFSKKSVEIDFSSLSEGVGTVIKFKIPVVKLS